MQPAPPIPRKPPIFLGFLIVALLGIVVLATIRSKGGSPRDPDREELALRPKRKPPLPKGPWKLLKITPASVAEVDVPGIGHIKSTRPRWDTGTTVWVKLPQNTIYQILRVTAKFGKLPPVPVLVSETSKRGVVGVLIPASYPSEYTSCVLRIQQGPIDLSAQKIEGLPPTKRTWPKQSLTVGPVKCGPGTVSARTWKVPDNSPAGNIQTEITVSIPQLPGENWEIFRLDIKPPAFMPTRYRLSSFEEYPHSSSRIEKGSFIATFGAAVPLAELQGEVMEEGRLCKYEIGEEFVEFHDVPLQQDPSPYGGKWKSLFASPTEPLVAFSPSGVKVTLLPPLRKTRQGLQAEISPIRSVLFLTYKMDPGEILPTDLPKSPVLKGRKFPVAIRLLGEAGTVNVRLDSSEDENRGAVKRGAAKDHPYILATTGGDYKVGICPTLRLRIRHRVELETHPFRFVTPILPAPPADLHR